MLNSHPRRPLLAAFVVFLLAAIAAASLIWRLEQYSVQEERVRVVDLAEGHASALQRYIERALSATYVLAALVRQGGGVVRDFDAVAAQLLPLYPGVSELAFSSGGIIRSVVPLVGNEKAIGHDLLNDPAQRKEAILARDSGELTLAGPLKLVQGGTGVVGRLPVFIDDARGKPSFWGFTLVMIRFPEVIAAARLPLLMEQGFAYELWRIHPDSGNKHIIAASSPAALIDPVVRTLHVPNATWTLSVAPLGGWGDPRKLAPKVALGLFLSLLLAYLAKLLFELRAHQEGLEALVGQRTADVRAREADLNRAQSIARVGSWALDLANNELRGSAEAIRIFGVVAGVPFNYRDFLERVHPDDRDAVELASRASLKGEPFDIEYRILAGGATRWVHNQAELTFGAERRLCRAQGTVQDITERKEADDALRASEARYRELFEANPQPMWVFDLQTLDFLAVNDAAVAHYGYSRDEFLAMIVTDIRPPEEVPRLLQRVALVQKQDIRDAGIWRHRRKDGTLIDVEVASHTLEFGGRRAQIVLANDVTERLQAERKLRESEMRFRSLTAMSSDFYWESDAMHRLTTRGSANKKLSTVSVFQQGAQIGERRWDIPYVSPDESGWKAHRAMLDAHLPFRDFEISRLGVDGTERHISISGDPVFDASGAFTGYRGVGTDITERKRHAEELRRLNAELEQRVAERTQALEAANNELEAFSHSVSRDLRAPLRAINDFNSMLEKQYASQIDEPGRDLLGRVGAAAKKMGVLIDDLLRLSRISRQAMRIGPIDLSALAREVAGELQAEAPERKIEWVIASKVSAEGDPGLLRVVLQNLLGNAWKNSYTREVARIEFGVGEKDGRSAYFVRDNGAGFDMAYAAKLFGAFQRLHSAAEFPGRGIGLAAVSRVIHRHGGEVWAEGRVGEGATFYFSLG